MLIAPLSPTSGRRVPMMPDDSIDQATLDRAIGALLGLAVGDAIGTTLEFTQRDRVEPVAEMVGGGPFELLPGQWTDDTSMALCLADSLIEAKGFDAGDLAARFVRWWRHGENSATGACFDIGVTTQRALLRFERSGDPFSGDTSRDSAGNGSLMRLAPIALFAHTDADNAASLAAQQSRTTHAAPQCLDACAVFARMLVAAIGGEPKEAVLERAATAADPDLAGIRRLAWRKKGRPDISSSGYVVDTLEAALWAVDRSKSFRDAIVLAANLGGDADTVAAVTGQLAGALWGAAAILEDWLQFLWWQPRLRERAETLFRLGRRARG